MVRLLKLRALPLAEGEGVRSTILTWTLGHLDTWTLGHLDAWTLLDTWTPGHFWTFGNLDTWTLGHVDIWTLARTPEIHKKSSEIDVLENEPEH